MTTYSILYIRLEISGPDYESVDNSTSIVVACTIPVAVVLFVIGTYLPPSYFDRDY